MIATDTAADVIIPGHALPTIEENGSRGVRLLDLTIIFDDLRRQDGRAVALALAERLGIVRLIIVHPAQNSGIVLMPKADGVLSAYHADAVLLKFLELLFRRPPPEADVHVDADVLVFCGVAGVLQPYRNGEELGVD